MNSVKAYSLAVDQTLQADYTTYATYNNRKITDFRYILFIYGDRSPKRVRATALTLLDEWQHVGYVQLSALHGSQADDITTYKLSTAYVEYVDETHYKASLFGSKAITRLSIVGIG